MELDTTPLKERRIKDATAARTVWGKLREASKPRRDKWAQVQNQADGAPPMSNLDLINSGQGWRCNVNFRDAASTLDQVLVSYWRLLHDTTNLASITVQNPDDPNAERWGQIFQQAFNRFNEDWGADYVRTYLLFAQNHVLFGIGTAFWNDRYNPRWESLRVGELEVPAKAKSSVEKLKIVGLSQEMEFEDLWDLIRTPEKTASAAAAGWNIPELKKLLVNELLGRQGDKTAGVSESEDVELQRQLRNNSYGVCSGFAPVKLIHFFVKDFDGKITRYIFCEGHTYNAEFLFSDEGADRPKEMTEILGAVFFDAGNGDWWGVKGFGLKNFQLSSILNRLKSRAVDRTMIDGLNFIDLEEGGRETVPIVNVGPFNFLPKNVQQLPNYPTGRSILETVAMVESNANSNNARYRDQSAQIAGATTATEVNALTSMQAQVDVSNATLYLRQIAQAIFKEQLRRLRMKDSPNEDAKAFYERCVTENKMDEETFYSAKISITTGADPGAANLMVQGQKAIEGLSLPGANQRWFAEKWVAANFGAQAVSKALIPVDATSEIRSARAALMENSDMGEGNPLPVDPQDNHAAHIPQHLQPAEVIVHNFEMSGQLNPQALVALQNVIPHLEGHFNYMKGDRLQEALYRETWPRFTAVKSAAEGMFRMVERIHNQSTQAGQPPVSGGPQGQTFDPAGLVGATTPQ